MTNNNYKNWKEFINAALTKNKQFRLDNSFQKGQTDIEIYRQLLGDTETTLKIGYLAGDRLIYIDTFNDKTPGLNKNQIEYFNEHDFSESKSYGKPGLEFNEVNQQGVLDQLSKGLSGIEIIYLKDGKPSFSKLTIHYDNDENNSSTHTYNFDNISVWTRLKKMFNKQDKNYQTIEINLKNIFGGLK
jgi:hypothetical protein